MYRAGALLAAATLVFSAACTVLDNHKRVDGWPRLTIREHYVPHSVMRDKCVKYAPMGTSPEACAEIYFKERRCDIWLSADFPPPLWMVRHERLHCDGHDHIGSTQLRDAWHKYLDDFAAGRL